jgi:hypothetical protein
MSSPEGLPGFHYPPTTQLGQGAMTAAPPYPQALSFLALLCFSCVRLWG